MAIDLSFKYGAGNLPNKKAAGNVYIKKVADATNTNKDNGRAVLYVDTPVATAGSVERLQVSGDVYVGKSSDTAAQLFQVVIDPDGEILNPNFVTSESPGFKLKIEKATGNVDTYIPSTQGLSGNTIIFVVE